MTGELMKRVFSSENTIDVWQIRNLLEVEGIDTVVKNADMSSAFGEVPFVETWPEVWVKDPADYEHALDIVDEYLYAEDDDRPDWRCSKCRERNDAAFAVCWNCQTPARTVPIAGSSSDPGSESAS